MSEGTKTLSFIGVALVVLVIAIATQPRLPAADPQSPAGRILNQVTDPLSATRLEIMEYDEDTAALHRFEVAHLEGRWVIPSRQNYPADAEQQMGDAATSVMNRKILDVVTTNSGDHELYGVVEPQQNLTAGAVGVGTRVTMRNAKNDTLVNMVIGKPVKDQEGQHYVREIGKDPVYVVDLDPSFLSTDFSRWIEKDLLQLDQNQVTGLELKDYSVELSLGADGRPQILMDPRSEIQLACDPNAQENSWTVAEMKEFDADSKELKVVEAPQGEQLDEVKLDELKRALDDLKIVDVERKPKGLSDDLKAEADFANNMEALQSLATRGFYPVPISQSNIEIFSSEGEVNCQMADGVQYILRFGKIVLGEGQKTAEGRGTGINRYLFVSARFNEDAIERPELKELPVEEVSETEATEAEAADEAADAEEAPAEGETAEAEAAEGETADAEAADDETAEPAQDETAKQAEREAIEQENQQKLAAYEQRLEAGRERVKQLNSRFGDWYYVISDDVYKKIHLGRKDIFNPAETTPGEGLGIGDLDALELQGLE